MLNVVPDDDNVVRFDHAAALSYFVAQASRLEHNNLKMVGPMKWNTRATIQDEKSNVDWIGRGEWPNVKALPADLTINERIGTLPGKSTIRIP